MYADDILSAKHHAAYLAERLLIAYYARNDDQRAYHVERAHESLKAAAAAMGYTVTLSDALPSDWIPDDMHIYNVAS
jgi:hypothetical protein